MCVMIHLTSPRPQLENVQTNVVQFLMPETHMLSLLTLSLLQLLVPASRTFFRRTYRILSIIRILEHEAMTYAVTEVDISFLEIVAGT